MQGALLTGSALRLAWNLSSREISLELNFVSLFFFFFLPRYIVTLPKKYYDITSIILLLVLSFLCYFLSYKLS